LLKAFPTAGVTFNKLPRYYLSYLTDRASMDRASMDRASMDRASMDRAVMDRALIDRALMDAAVMDRALMSMELGTANSTPDPFSTTLYTVP
jgi:hypothetical protein